MAFLTLDIIHPKEKEKQYALTSFEGRFMNLATVESLIPVHAKEKQQYALVYFKGRLLTENELFCT